jgi:hypothetical protein
VAETLVGLEATNIEGLLEDVRAEPVGVVTVSGGSLSEDLGESLGVVFSGNTNVVVLLDVEVDLSIDGPFLLLVVFSVQLN